MAFFFFFPVTTFISEVASAQLPAGQARFTDSVVATLSSIVPTHAFLHLCSGTAQCGGLFCYFAFVFKDGSSYFGAEEL